MQVIGDKRGGGSSRLFAEGFEHAWELLVAFANRLQLPVAVIRVIRNPFNQIASNFMRAWWHTREAPVLNQRGQHVSGFNASVVLRHGPFLCNGSDASLSQFGANLRNVVGRAREYFKLAKANDRLKIRLTNLFGQLVGNYPRKRVTKHRTSTSNSSSMWFHGWLDVLQEEFIANPVYQLHQMCTFLDVECTDSYIAAAVSIVSSTASEPSQAIVWSVGRAANHVVVAVVLLFLLFLLCVQDHKMR